MVGDSLGFLRGVPLLIVLDMSSLTFSIPPLIWGSHH